ncbi:MAG: LamG domain-containing protein [Pseudomonadota bacterium]
MDNTTDLKVHAVPVPPVQGAQNEPEGDFTIPLTELKESPSAEDEKDTALVASVVHAPPVQPVENEKPGGIQVPVVHAPPVQGTENERVVEMRLPSVRIPPTQAVDNEPFKKMVLPLSGKLITAEDPLVVGKNFRTLTNMRHGDAAPKSIGGMTKINTNILNATYYVTRNAHHFRKIQPAETVTIENHVLVQGYNAELTLSLIRDNTAIPPAQGQFSGTALWTDSYASAATGRFSDVPGGKVAYCNGVDTCLWGGNGIPVTGFITSTADVTDSPTNPKDYTDAMQNTRTDSENIAIIGGGTDAYTGLLLHGDGGAAGAVTDSATAGAAKAMTAIGGTACETWAAKFGISSIAFDGVDGNLTTPDHTDFDFSGGIWTIDFWMWAITPITNAAIFYQDLIATGVADSIALRIDTDDGLDLVIQKTGAGGDVTVSTAAGVITGGAWHHIAVVENGDSYVLYVDGVSVGTATSTVRPQNYDDIFQIGGGSGFINGYIDEFRVSKGIARWTAAFTPPAGPYTASARYFLVRSPLPIKGGKFYIAAGRGNVVTSTLTMKEWNGYSWITLTQLTNGSTSGGIALYQTGAFTVASTVGTSKLKFIEGGLGYWYLFTLSDGEAEIYYMTLDAPFQQIQDVWDGIDRSVSAFFKYTTTYTDYTLNVREDDYDTQDETTHADLSSLGAFNSATGANCVIMGFFERQAGFNIGVPSDGLNAVAGTLSIDYWDGSGFVEAGHTVDGTAEGGKPLAKPGTVSITIPDPWNVFKRTLANNSTQLYYYRLRSSGALTAGTAIYYVSGIPAPKQIRGYKFPIYSQDCLMLCCNMDGKRNSILVSAPYTSQVFSGTSSLETEFGNEEEINAGCTVFSQYGSNLFNITMLFKDKEVWNLVRNETTWLKYMVSGTVGCPAGLTLDTVNIPPIEGQQNANRCLAIWEGSDGVYVSEGRHPICVSHDIRDLWDQNATVHINQSYIKSHYGRVDQAKLEYHLFVAVTTGTVTTLDDEWVLDLRRWEWCHVDRGTGKKVQCAINVIDAYGVNHSYGFIDTGYMERLEYGNTFDGNAIISTFQTGDFPLIEGDFLTETRVRKFVQAMVAKVTTTADVKLTHFVDAQDEVLTLDVAAGTAWAVNDTITGATSGSKCEIVKIYSTTVFGIRNRTGDFTLGEVLSNGTYTADQGASFPTVTGPADYTCDPTLSYYRITFPVKDANSTPGIFHSVRETITVSNEATGFEPLALGIYYEVVRDHLS